MKPLKISQTRRGRKQNKLWLGLVAILVVIFIIFFALKNSTSFTFSFNDKPTVEADNQINILLLGYGGDGHDGPYLTDSMLLLSYNLLNKQVTFISIPRDIWINKYKAKINSLYTIGRGKGNGLQFTESEVGQFLGVNIDYAIGMDFSGFQKAIDQVGGIDVTVDNTFDDYVYPIEGEENDLCNVLHEETRNLEASQAADLGLSTGQQKVLVDSSGNIATDSADPNKALTYFPCRFEHIHFDAGLTHMDGTTALKFVRSRHAIGAEGSDFARSRRQQKVIEAFRAKALSLGTLVNPEKLTGLIKTFGNSFQTDIPIPEIIKLYRYSKQFTKSQNFVLDNIGGVDLLINPPISQYGAWVLVPQDSSLKEMQTVVNKLLEGDTVYGATTAARPRSSQL